MGHHHDLLGVTQARQSTNLTGHQINEIAHKDKYPGSPCTRLLLGTTTHPRTEATLLVAPAAGGRLRGCTACPHLALQGC
jgi:hypothetical protein